MIVYRENCFGKVERIHCGHVNRYIISNGKNAVLAYTGTKVYRRRFIEALKLYKPNLIVPTHGHVEHVQNAYLFHKSSMRL